MYQACAKYKMRMGNRQSAQVFHALQKCSNDGWIPHRLDCGQGAEKLPQIHH